MALPRGYSARSTRTIEDLKSGTDILSGADSQALRTYCTSEILVPGRDLNNDYGRLLTNGDLEQLQAHFQSRAEALGNDPSAAAQELSNTKWGPTQLPIFNIILMFMYQHPSIRPSYLNMSEWLINTARVNVDGTDLSGTTALAYSISTKPYFDTQFAEMLHAAGGNINHRNRYGETAAHDFVKVMSYDAESRRRPVEALKWFLSHGGDLEIKCGDGMTAKYIITRLAPIVPELKAAMDDAEGGGGTSSSGKKVGRNEPCPCESGKKYKACCGKN